MNQFPKKHHYVPVFYLKGFADPASVDPQKPGLWVYAQGEPPRKSTPVNEGYEKHANTVFLPNGTRDAFLEIALANDVDSPAAGVITNIAANVGVDLSDTDIGILSRFAGFQFARTPTGRYISEKVSGRAAEEAIRNAAKSREGFADFIREQLGTDAPTDEGIEELHQQVIAQADSLDLSRETALLSMIDIAHRYATRLAEWNWVLIYADRKQEFVTSDNPFITSIYEVQTGFMWMGMGLGHDPQVQVYLPLARNVCAWIGKDIRPGWGTAAPARARAINSMVMHCAQRHIFAGHNSRPLAKAFNRRGCKLRPGVNSHLPPSNL